MRVFVSLAAVVIMPSSFRVSAMTMLPNPMKTGFSPLFIQSMRLANFSSSTAGGGALGSFVLRSVKVPTTRHCSGQSAGLGTKLGLHMALKGTPHSTMGLAKLMLNGIRGNLSVCVLHRLMYFPSVPPMTISNIL